MQPPAVVLAGGVELLVLLGLTPVLVVRTGVDDDTLVVEVTRVVDETAVVLVLLGTALLDEPPPPVPEHPMRDDATAISSYQKVLVSPPYDSQPK